MKIRKYVARNMPEALQQVRDDLGEQAVILNTRTLRRNNRFNLAAEARVEVTAAYDEAPAVQPAGPARLAARKYRAQLPASAPAEPVAPQRRRRLQPCRLCNPYRRRHPRLGMRAVSRANCGDCKTP